MFNTKNDGRLNVLERDNKSRGYALDRVYKQIKAGEDTQDSLSRRLETFKKEIGLMKMSATEITKLLTKGSKDSEKNAKAVKSLNSTLSKIMDMAVKTSEELKKAEKELNEVRGEVYRLDANQQVITETIKEEGMVIHPDYSQILSGNFDSSQDRAFALQLCHELDKRTPAIIGIDYDNLTGFYYYEVGKNPRVDTYGKKIPLTDNMKSYIITEIARKYDGVEMSLPESAEGETSAHYSHAFRADKEDVLKAFMDVLQQFKILV